MTTTPKRDKSLRAKLRIAVDALDQIARGDTYGYPLQVIARRAQREIARVGAKKGKGK